MVVVSVDRYGRVFVNPNAKGNKKHVQRKQRNTKAKRFYGQTQKRGYTRRRG